MARSPRRRVAVTGLGVVSSLGNGRDEAWRRLIAGESGAGYIRQFDAAGWPVRIGCEVKNFAMTDPVFQADSTLRNRPTEFGLQASWEAMSDSGLSDKMKPDRFAVFVGAGNDAISPQQIVDMLRGYVFSDELKGLANFLTHQRSPEALMRANEPGLLAALLSRRWRACAGHTTIETACAAGAQAIGHGFRAIADGDADYVLSCGADSLAGELLFAGFCLLGVLSTKNLNPTAASRPFDSERDGFVAGEGAAALVLEEWEHAQARGAEIYAEVVGFGESANAYRVTDLPADGRGAILSMRAALKSAALDPEDIDYINAHGTSTAQNDMVEARAIREVFMREGHTPAVSSTKSATGHLVAAAGSIEGVFSVLAVQHGVMPPTLNFRKTDCGADLKIIGEPAVVAPINYAMSNSFGFGGTNATLILGKAV